MKPVHKVLEPFLRLGDYLGMEVLFLSEATPARNSLYSWLPFSAARQIAYQVLKSLDMAKAALLSAPRSDIVFIFEHKPWYSYPLYLVLYVCQRPVFFLVHDHQTAWRRSFFHLLGFRTLHFLVRTGLFTPVYLDKAQDNADPHIIPFAKFITTSLPLAKNLGVATEFSRSSSASMTIGIGGMLRPDKPIEGLLEAVRNAADAAGATARIGFPKWQNNERLVRMAISQGFEYVDTASASDYHDFLSKLDVMVFTFNREDFYFRPSGVVNDAISNRTVVVVPNYPVIVSQITQPTKVGVSYSSLEDLERSIAEACALARGECVDFDTWMSARSDEAILLRLSDDIKRQLESDRQDVS